MADDDGDLRGRDDDRDDDRPDGADDHTDDYDDDYYDDDDYDEREVDDRAADKRRRDTWLVAGAAAIIVIAVLVIVLKGDNKKSTDTGTGSSTDTSQVAGGTGSTTTAANSSPQWPELAQHPPKGLEGNGQPTPGAAPLAPGVYFWYSAFTGWYVKVIHGNGVGALQVQVGDSTPNGSPVALKDAAPTGVTLTTLSPSSLKLDFADGTADQLVHLDVNGLVGSLTWNFTGVPTSQVFLGVSPNPVGVTPFTVAKQAPK